MSALVIDWVGGSAVVPFRALITVQQDYDNMTEVIAGVLYNLDTDALWSDLKALESSDVGMPFNDLQGRNAAYTVAGTTYAPALFMLTDVTFEDLGPSNVYTVQMQGTNNDLWLTKSAGGPLLPQPNVIVSPGNSAGLIIVETADGAAIDAKLDVLIAAQDLTNEQANAEHTTSRTTGQVILRNTVVMRRWEAPAYEDEAQLIAYGTNANAGIESVGLLVEVAWS